MREHATKHQRTPRSSQEVSGTNSATPPPFTEEKVPSIGRSFTPDPIRPESNHARLLKRISKPGRSLERGWCGLCKEIRHDVLCFNKLRQAAPSTLPLRRQSLTCPRPEETESSIRNYTHTHLGEAASRPKGAPFWAALRKGFRAANRSRPGLWCLVRLFFFLQPNPVGCCVPSRCWRRGSVFVSVGHVSRIMRLEAFG